jgi:hypothetical protein
MTKIYGARDLAEAHFVKGLLEAEEIPAVIQGGALQAVLGEVPMTPESLPSVMVNERDAERAMQIVNEMKHGGPAATESQVAWKCPKCGEEIEGQFSSCWKCGAEKSDSK